jgi:hypothetical protein
MANTSPKQTLPVSFYEARKAALTGGAGLELAEQIG